MTATPLQQAQMTAVVANGGFLYRPSIVHHMTDADGNVVIVDDDSEIIARARPGRDGETILMDKEGNPLNDPTINVRFDEDGNFIFEPEVIDTLAVDREYLRVVQEGMREVNEHPREDFFGTGATYVEWDSLAAAGIPTAGKTGTAEYCDNIAIQRGWCRFEDIEQRRILPTHAWYVAYAPYDDPEIVVTVFVFNGGEGSAWATPIACHVIAAHFGVGQYASVTGDLTPEEAAELPPVCGSILFNPETPQLEIAADPEAAEESTETPVDFPAPIDQLPPVIPEEPAEIIEP
jgi:penicillin-binding protein 2